MDQPRTAASNVSSEPDGGHFSKGYLRYALGALFLLNVVNYMDRTVISVVIEPLRLEFGLSDTEVGLLTGFAFSAVYAVSAIVIARLADRYSRVKILSIGVTLWSLMTAVTGVAQSYLQLFLARMAVGVTDASAIPTAQALIADYFPPKRRSGAVAVFFAGSYVGIAAGFLLTGWVTDTFSWRWAFIVSGVSSIPIGIAYWFSLKEPKRGAVDGLSDVQAKSTFQALRELATNKTYVSIWLAIIILNFMLFAVFMWLPAYFMRSFGLTGTQVGLMFAVAFGVGKAAGAILGGWVGNVVSQKSMRALLIVPVVTTAVSVPLYQVAMWAPTVSLAIIALFLASTVNGAYSGPIYSAIHSVLHPSLRATALALLSFGASILGGSAAPFVVGLLSDYLRPMLGDAAGLQMAISITSGFGLSALIFLFIAHRNILNEQIASDQA